MQSHRQKRYSQTGSDERHHKSSALKTPVMISQKVEKLMENYCPGKTVVLDVDDRSQKPNIPKGIQYKNCRKRTKSSKSYGVL